MPTKNSKKMNGFRKMQLRLREKGWYVEWALPCCQSCAWNSIPRVHRNGPFTGKEINREKVLFNHEQDCAIDCDWDEETDAPILPEKYKERKFETMPCYLPEEVSGSLFGFAGDGEGPKYLREIMSIIEECGCKIIWSGDGDERPYIGWVE